MAYCTIEDVRAEGITEERVGDARLTTLISLATAYIDGITGQWFEPRDAVITIDGRGGNTLYLPVFLVEAQEVKVDGNPITDYVLYNRFTPDDRRNPRIYREAGWPQGRRNIEITGTWGYVEQDEEGYKTPELIKRVALRLVIREIPYLGDAEGQEERKRARIVSETTDGHSYTLAQLAGSLDLTGDPDIDGILALFSAPIAIGG